MADRYILTAAKLIAPFADLKGSEYGFDWVMEILQDDYEHLAGQVEIDKAIRYLKELRLNEAINKLKAFEKKGMDLKTMAATNLAFIYFLEGEFLLAGQNADLAISHDRYNAKALVNKGNCLFMAKEYHQAKEMYLEAIGVKVDCIQAILNLGLVNIRLGMIDDALRAFEKVYSLLPNNNEAIYHIGNIYENFHEDLSKAMKWFQLLHARVPSDPGVLAHLGQIANKQGDESQAYHYLMESYRLYPINLDVISWLGVWHVKSELYEEGAQYFRQAICIQPGEVKWKLMVASCYRRMGNYPKAFDPYEDVHLRHPNNIECLRYLVTLSTKLGHPSKEYQKKLARLNSIKSNSSSKPPHEKQRQSTIITQQSLPLQQQQLSSPEGQRAAAQIIEPPRARMEGDGRNLEATIAEQQAAAARDGVDHFKDVNVGDLLV